MWIWHDVPRERSVLLPAQDSAALPAAWSRRMCRPLRERIFRRPAGARHHGRASWSVSAWFEACRHLRRGPCGVAVKVGGPGGVRKVGGDMISSRSVLIRRHLPVKRPGPLRRTGARPLLPRRRLRGARRHGRRGSGRRHRLRLGGTRQRWSLQICYLGTDDTLRTSVCRQAFRPEREGTSEGSCR